MVGRLFATFIVILLALMVLAGCQHQPPGADLWRMI